MAVSLEFLHEILSDPGTHLHLSQSDWDATVHKLEVVITAMNGKLINPSFTSSRIEIDPTLDSGSVQVDVKPNA